MFQRPKRASSISTDQTNLQVRSILNPGFNALNGLLPFLPIVEASSCRNYYGFQRPKRASSISTRNIRKSRCRNEMFQRPKRASSISTRRRMGYGQGPGKICFNALNGLLPFLQPPLGTRINPGFPASFLQVFV